STGIGDVPGGGIAGDLENRVLPEIARALCAGQVDGARTKVQVRSQDDIARGCEIETRLGVEVRLAGQPAKIAIRGRHIEILDIVDNGPRAVVAEEIEAGDRIACAIDVRRVEAGPGVEHDRVRRNRRVLRTGGDTGVEAAVGDGDKIP